MPIGGNLPAMGLIQYGNFVFPDACTETMNCSIKPQYDAGKRTVTDSLYDITLRTYIDGNPSDANVQLAIAELTKAGQRFQYTGHGCSNLTVNVGLVKDVRFGPLPQLVSLKPIGADKVCEITWNVQVSVPTCSDAVYQFAPLEFSFSLTFSIAENGFTTRNYEAKLRIPNNRLFPGSRLILDSPDSYRESLAPKLPPGFRRTSQSYTINDAKTTITATITDEEFLNPLPNYIVTGSASHNYQSVPNSMGLQWTGTIEADYEVPRTSDVVWAVDQFLNLYKNRINDVKKILSGAGVPDANGRVSLGGPGKVTPMVKDFRISEPNIHGPGGQRGKFSLHYFVGACGFAEILKSGGLWNRTGNWDDWYASLKGSTGVRGAAGLRFLANEDALVDLCGKSTPSVPNSRPSPLVEVGTGVAEAVLKGILAGRSGDVGAGGDFDADPTTGDGLNSMPEADGGWLKLRCYTEVEEDHGVIIAPVLPANPLVAPSQRPGWDILNFGRPASGIQQTPFPPASDYTSSGQSSSQSQSQSSSQSSSSTSSVQRRTTPIGFVTIRGYALRWARPIPCPQAFNANGQPLVNCNRLDMGEGFTQGIVGHCTFPIYWASWALRYHASEAILAPGQFPIPPNTLG